MTDSEGTTTSWWHFCFRCCSPSTRKNNNSTDPENSENRNSSLEKSSTELSDRLVAIDKYFPGTTYSCILNLEGQMVYVFKFSLFLNRF